MLRQVVCCYICQRDSRLALVPIGMSFIFGEGDLLLKWASWLGTTSANMCL